MLKIFKRIENKLSVEGFGFDYNDTKDEVWLLSENKKEKEKEVKKVENFNRFLFEYTLHYFCRCK